KLLYLRKKKMHRLCHLCQAVEWVIWAECINIFSYASGKCRLVNLLLEKAGITSRPFYFKKLI
ncbi:MAG: hypothetical protein O6940_09630, partial [Ignavibacteria bacterium]|nr:hypothetical protein [Ignavibacteria bacterium]